ncbi:MAG: dTDP-4-dehydrorhamnose reductase [Saprospiraceae bacterium]|nr:dTDP-4-dehydrorhamnose reductase [Lewinellaceae bacterium]
MTNPTILVAGAKGQLGQCFQHLAGDYPRWNFQFVDIDELDITNRAAVFTWFKKNTPQWCINCAAYAAVDKAENDTALARRVNVAGARNLAEACAEHNAMLIHFSTDYVYHTKHNAPYRESDATSPKGVYARTKLAGDLATLKANPEAMIFRTSWLFAPYGHNFVRTILRFGAEQQSLNVVYDQLGSPTYAPDLAAMVLQLVEKVELKKLDRSALAGIWHYSNEGVCSWYDFAKAVVDIKGLPCKINPIETKDYPLPAPRPPFSVLNKAKIKQAFGVEIPHWRDSLERCLTIL